MGTDEMAQNKIQLKNLKTKEQHTLDIDNIESILNLIKA
jgi:histidyl-tRNA synthetase